MTEPRDPGHTFVMYAGDTVVSRYLTDGPNGRKGDPVKFLSWEIDTAGAFLARIGLVVSARCVR
jgi:hypothetical protein